MQNVKLRVGSVLACLIMCLSVLLSPVDVFAASISEDEFLAFQSDFTTSFHYADDGRTIIKKHKYSNVDNVSICVVKNSSGWSFYMISSEPFSGTFTDASCLLSSKGQYSNLSSSQNIRFGGAKFESSYGTLYYAQPFSYNSFDSSNGLNTCEFVGAKYLINDDGTVNVMDTMARIVAGYKDPYVVEIKKGSEDLSSTGSDLGYLKDVSAYQLNISDPESPGDLNVIIDTLYKFTWGSQSSTGVNLMSSGNYVQLYIYSQYGQSKEIYDYYFYPELIPASDLTFSYSKVDLFPNFKNCYAAYQEDLNHDSILDFLMGKAPEAVYYTFYLRIVNEDCSDRGPWLKVDITFDKESNTYHSTVSTPGEFDEGNNFVGDPANSSTSSSGMGTGVNQDDAFNDMISKDDFNIDDSAVWENAQALVDGVGNMPKLIASVFSFLPSWCLQYIAVAFALLLVLIVYKLIRG